jgi:hypothetical protein
MTQSYNVVPSNIADRIAKTFYYYKGRLRWWDGRTLRNKEKIKEYTAANKEKKKEYWAANKEKLKEKNKEYRAANKEKIKEKKKEYQKEYRERANKRRRLRYKNDENYRIKTLLRSRFEQALKSQNIKKNSHVLELTSCSMDFLRKYLEKKFEKGMTWENKGQWHIDHRKPCASFNLANKEEPQMCFHYTNLQPLWGSANLEKSSTFDEATFEYTWIEKKGWAKKV